MRPGNANNDANNTGPISPVSRIASIDQLRGYAIFGMIFVNFLSFGWLFGPVLGMPNIIDHSRNHFSYADTIAPLFIFVVGMGFRLSLKRRIETMGAPAARWSAFKRYMVLLLVAIMFYGPVYRIDWWDALTHIALAGMICLPFMDKRIVVRIGVALGFLAAYELIMFATPYSEWLRNHSMNGGPLGTFSYVYLCMFGSIAYDLLTSGDSRRILTQAAGYMVAMFVGAYILYKVIPYARLTEFDEYAALWPFAKRWSMAPFTLLSCSLCFAAFLAFYWLCDLRNFRVPGLTILGENPLVIYLLQYSLLAINGTYIDHWLVQWFGEETVSGGGGLHVTATLVMYVLFYWFVYAVAKRLHRDKIIVKL